MSGLTGLPFIGRLSKLTESIRERLLHATIVPSGNGRASLDVMPKGYYEDLIGQVVEAGSDNTVLVKTAHSLRVGDMIRWQTTTNVINEKEVFILEIINANSVRLSCILSADLTAGDTYTVLRPITPTYASNGSLTVTASSAIQFLLNAVLTSVSEDTVTPANSRPLPVKLMGVAGPINITAGDLHVQLSHTNDSVSIGDGVDTWSINGSGEGLVNDSGTHSRLDTVNTNLTNIEADTTSAAADLDALSNALASIATDSLRVSTISSVLPTGAATSANQTLEITELQDINTELNTQTGHLASLAGEDFATEATLAQINNKLNSLGQKTMANSVPVVISSDQSAVPSSQSGTWNINNIGGTISLPTGASTEATLAALNAKFGSIGQQPMASSAPVVIASNQTDLPIKVLDCLENINVDFSSTNIFNSSDTLIHTLGGTGTKKIQVFMSFGEPVALKVNGTTKAIIPPGGFQHGGLELTIPASATIRLRNLGATATVNSGLFIANLMG
jgi:hypothetical protein